MRIFLFVLLNIMMIVIVIFVLTFNRRSVDLQTKKLRESGSIDYTEIASLLRFNNIYSLIILKSFISFRCYTVFV